MSKPNAYHAGYDAGVRDERKRCQQEIGSLKEQLADALKDIKRLRLALRVLPLAGRGNPGVSDE